MESSIHPAIATESSTSHFKVMRRTGEVVDFKPEKISNAMMKAFLATKGGSVATSSAVRDAIKSLTQKVVAALTRRLPQGGIVQIEDIQDQVELALMRSGEHEVARAYVLYREARAKERAMAATTKTEYTVLINGELLPLSCTKLKQVISMASQGLQAVDPDDIFHEVEKNIYDGITQKELYRAVILAARSLIEKDPQYSFCAARLLLHVLRAEVLDEEIFEEDMQAHYQGYFPVFVKKGIEAELLDQRLLQFDLEKLAHALKPERDLQFNYLGLQTLYDRYFLHVHEKRIELPQVFFMRVAMGLALNEIDMEDKAIEFYEILSSFDFMSSTPTLFNSGTKRAQLSSCYLTTVPDDLDGIYEAIKENALLSKYAGGLGNDWTRVRAMGSHIKGTNGKSQGVVPFLKVVNDTAVAVNQGGKRKGAVCAYLETWHLDIEEFLELRKNTGDERRRTHDMNTANWIPDLFMKRVAENGTWTLFSPSDVPDLHEKHGKAFEKAYSAYEEKVAQGEIKHFKQIPALELWRKMLSMLFETGHPWITFKDPCNIRSPQQHVGIVHSSNLCTEITLNTSDEEIAVCNLGSINLARHLTEDGIDRQKLQKTIKTAMRMLDNVIDINYYAVKKARRANLRHRPVGLGIMGFQDCLYRLGLSYSSSDAVEFADHTMEAVCYYAYNASAELARERGAYPTFKGSLWDQGILPYDSLALLEKERGGYLEVDQSTTMDWDALREKISQFGMRNSNCVAIAPTATIANIVGVSSSIEPTYENLYVKSNLSGEFTVINSALVEDLKQLNLWDEVMVADLKYFDGSVAPIERIPDELKKRYATAFEIDPVWLVEAAARRQKWIDQSQSLNLYFASVSGKKLDEIYRLAWLRGLKTTYYLRTLAASRPEKATTERSMLLKTRDLERKDKEESLGNSGSSCAIDNPECESCQ